MLVAYLFELQQINFLKQRFQTTFQTTLAGGVNGPGSVVPRHHRQCTVTCRALFVAFEVGGAFGFQVVEVKWSDPSRDQFRLKPVPRRAECFRIDRPAPFVLNYKHALDIPGGVKRSIDRITKAWRPIGQHVTTSL